MKLLLQSYELIVANWMGEDDSSEEDLAHALSQFTKEAVNKKDLLPMFIKQEEDSCKQRDYCEGTCDSKNNIMFKRISGSFCSKCGYVYPF